MPPRVAQPGEDRRQRPGVEVDRGAEALGQDARQVLGEAAAGDVGERVDAARADRGERGADVDARRAPAAPRRGVPSPNGAGRVPAEAGRLDDAAHEAVAVGVDAARGEAEQHVARRDAARAGPRRAPSRRPRSPRGRSRRRGTCPASRPSRRRRARSPALDAARGDALDHRARPASTSSLPVAK